MNYKYPLATDTFTFWDKLKIAKWILGNNQWTQGKLVKEYERLWSDYTGCPFVVMTTSGSASNELIALRLKHNLQSAGRWNDNCKVIFPANTWISSVSVFINLGFKPVFIDLDKNTLCADINLIKKEIKRDPDICYVFYTTLLGFTGDLVKLERVCKDSFVGFGLDNCETPWSYNKGTHCCNYTTASTSLYFSHPVTSGSESGLVFCQDEEEYAYYLMARSHGMTRVFNNYKENLSKDYFSLLKNDKVDPNFDFNILGSNYRSSDYLAFPAILDFKKKDKSIVHRKKIYKKFTDILALSEHFHIIELNYDQTPFALPIILKNDNPKMMNEIKGYLKENSIEFRQLVGAHLLDQSAFKPFRNKRNYKISKYLAANAIYIGLTGKLNEEIVTKWARHLITLASLNKQQTLGEKNNTKAI